jgi:endonuclease YncB( thermonuclease family)
MRLLASLSFFAFAFCSAHAAAPVTAIAGYIFDGDTFAASVRLENDVRVSVRVRILGIDAPEIHGECESEIAAAFKARDELSKLLPEGSVAELSDIKDDKYLGRIDANVKTADGRDVGAAMLSSGLARKYSGEKRRGWCE